MSGCVEHKKEDTISMNPDIIESMGSQKEFFQSNNFKIVNWKEAKDILLNKKIKGGKQYHTGWLTIYTTNGEKYLVKQPKMDALWEFMKEKDVELEGFGTE